MKQLEFDAIAPLSSMSIKESIREQLAGLAERQAARAAKRRVTNSQALARKRLPPEQRVDRRKGAW